MHRVLPLLALAALSTSCESPPVAAEPEQIAEIDTCRVIADAAIELIDEYLDATESLPPSELTSGSAPALLDLSERTAAVEQRALELGCSDEDVRERVAGHVEDLEGTTLASLEFIRQLRSAYGVSP